MAKKMSEQEYFKAVAQIRSYTAGGQLEEAERLLEQMYMYKPVRLLWFVAKAEFVLKQTGDTKKAMGCVNGRFCFEKELPGLEECMRFRLETWKQSGKMADFRRERYSYRKTCGKDFPVLEEQLSTALEGVAQDSENENNLLQLGRIFLRTMDIVSFLVIQCVQLRRKTSESGTRGPWFKRVANFGYLDEKINSEERNTFVLVMDEYLDRSLEILGSLLSEFGHQVFLLTPPLPFETEGQVELGETAAISLGQTEKFPDMCVIPPITLTQGGEPYGDNRAYLIDHICREESRQDNVVILCSGHLLEELCVRGELRGRIGRLSAYANEVMEEKLQFGWAGSYLSYISDIYGYDVRADLNAPAEVDFSIVIPARNSAGTLRYTLQTCLKQRYRGSYEIVVSDNSVDQDTSVYDLCQEFNDPRIRYVRTPRLLQLTKSFEFAYLQARGAFIFSIGSDDALLPWSLEAVKHVLDSYPEEDILQWERGFYAWPGFNRGQENMLQIVRKYERGQLSVYQKKTVEFLEEAAEDLKSIYNMPLLYINSGFRRRYFKTLFERTGKLWDGGNQDLQMGVINCCIYDHILQMVYPITIAGMSRASLGYLGQRTAAGEEKKEAEMTLRRQCRNDNVGVHVSLARERQLMPVGVDACSFYLVLSRAVEEGLLSEAAADQILDWRTAVRMAFETYLIINDNYDLFVHKMKAAAERLGKAQADWFMRKIYRTVLTPRYIDEKTATRKKSYQEGTDSFKGITLDASKYGVRNVAEAADLFAIQTGL